MFSERAIWFLSLKSVNTKSWNVEVKHLYHTTTKKCILKINVYIIVNFEGRTKFKKVLKIESS